MQRWYLKYKVLNKKTPQPHPKNNILVRAYKVAGSKLLYAVVKYKREQHLSRS